MWDDLNAIADESDQDLTHFIGPMVVIAQAFPHDVPRYLVIDGQQRLMTLSVLLSALRDHAKNLKLNPLADAIESNTLFFLNTKGEKVKKIIHRVRDREALDNILNLQIDKADQDLFITQAYNYFYGEIEQMMPIQSKLFGGREQPDLLLERLYKAMNQRLKIVMITLDKGDDPSNIYESLNFKHETLKDAALIRNYVFMKLKTPEEQETFDSVSWKVFEELFSFGPDQDNLLTDFYYRYLISKTEYTARKRLYTSFTKYIDEFLKTKKLEELVNELKRYANYFIAIVKECPDDVDLEVAFARFRMLEADTAIPLLLSLYAKYKTKGFSKTMFLRMLRIVESFILRRLFLRERTRGYGLDFAVAVEHSVGPDDLMKYFADRGWPTNEEILNALQYFELYERAPKQCKLILTEIERSFGHKEKIKLDDIQIEHVMPQNLTQNWREMLGDKAEERHEKFLHTLGNLTLTGYNSELGDKPFAEKKVEFQKSKISLNEYFEKYDKWAEKEIIARTNALYERFIDLWDRPEKLVPAIGMGKKNYIRQKIKH